MLRPGLVLLIVTWLLAGCSRTELLYENADWLIYRWAIGLVDATDAQADAWRGQFDRLLADHRARLLPDLVALLGAIEVEAQSGLNPHRLDCLLRRSDSLYRAHARLAVPLAVRILGELSPGQIDFLAEQFAERNAEYTEKYLAQDASERLRDRVERYSERVEYWTGRLSKAQRGLLEDAIGRMPETAGPWLAYRRVQQQRLLDLLRGAASSQQLGEFLTRWWVELADRPPALANDILTVRWQSIALAVAIDASLDPAQRARVVKRVSRLRADLVGHAESSLEDAAVVVAAGQPDLMTRCG